MGTTSFKKGEKKGSNENTDEKCVTHNRKLNNLLEYLNRQNDGKSYQPSRVIESSCED